MKKFRCLLFILTIVVCSLRVSMAAEHPGEHPGTTAAPKEHPGQEHPGMAGELSAGQIIQGIKAHISEVTKANNGSYPLFDTRQGQSLSLKLLRVHEDKVSYIKKEDAYFACTDFITNAGTKYDVDFWMKQGRDGKLTVYDKKIHKKDGLPRFTYQDDEIVEVGPAMAHEEPTMAPIKKRFIAPEAGT